MGTLAQWLAEATGTLYEDTLGMLLDPARRVFLPGLLVTLVIAALLSARGGGWRGVLGRLFERRIWLHRSSRLDLGLIVANAALPLLMVVPLGLSAFGVATSVVGWLDATFGIAEVGGWSDAAVTGLYTVALFVSWDLSRYLLHRLLHTVPVLFAIHKVHHSAEVMTPLTLYRVHPVERALFGLRGVLVTGLVTGVFFHLFRDRSVQLELLGINALGFLFNALGANLRHSHVWLSYGRVLEHLFISPAQHQVHHSVDAQHQQSNYGTCLAIWDWMFGSLLTTTATRMQLRFGLRREDQNHDPHGLVSALLEPLSLSAKSLPPTGIPSSADLAPTPEQRPATPT